MQGSRHLTSGSETLTQNALCTQLFKNYMDYIFQLLAAATNLYAQAMQPKIHI